MDINKNSKLNEKNNSYKILINKINLYWQLAIKNKIKGK